MNNLPKITVISCVYNLFEQNRVETFKQMIESIQNQTYKNIEHIIITGNSTDDTQNLIDKYFEDGFISYNYCNKNNPWHAMQKGIEVATGDFINFMNSDDFFCDKNAIELNVSNLIKNNADWSYSDANLILNNGSKRIMKGQIEKAPFQWAIHHQSMFVNLNVLKDFGGFDFNYKFSLDNYLILKLILRKKKSIYIEKPLITFRYGGWSSKQSLKELEEDYALNFYDQIGKSFSMSLQDCKDIWWFGKNNSCSYEHLKKLAKKIRNEDWRKTFLQEIKNYKN